MTVVTHTLAPILCAFLPTELIARSVRYIKVFTAMIIPLAIQYPPGGRDHRPGPRAAGPVLLHVPQVGVPGLAVCSCCPALVSPRRPPSSPSPSADVVWPPR